MKKLYILGSGFTKAFSKKSPVINDIFNGIKDNSVLEKINYYKSIGIVNNEEISSLILDDLYDFDHKDIINKKMISYSFLNEIVSNFIGLKADEPEFFKKLISDKFKSNNNDTIYIATFNYDTLIEDYSEHVNYLIPINSNPYEDITYEVMYANYDKPINILKLHGSINWYNNNIINTNIMDTYFVKKNDKSRMYIEKTSLPVLVPFVFNKSHFMNGDLFKTIWRKMDMILNEVDEIECIGYGFPKTDFQIFPTLYEFKDKIKKVIVYENDNRLVQLFGNKLVIGDARLVF
jgi:hypothetical protein